MRSSWLRSFSFLALSGAALPAGAFDMPVATPLTDGLKNPESVAVGVSKVDGKFKFTTVVSEIGEFGTDGDGKITIIDGAKKSTLADGLDDPKGVVFVGDQLFVTDKTRVWRIGPKGGKEVFAAAEAFPTKPNFLNDIEADAAGNLYVSDSGEFKDGKPAGTGGAVFKITPDGKATTLLDQTKVKTPNGLLMDGADALLVGDFTSGELNRVSLKDGSSTKIADGLIGCDGLVFDYDGNLYATSWSEGVVSLLRDGKGPAVAYGPKFQASADLCLNPKTGQLMIPDMKAGTLVGVSIVSAAPTDIDASAMTDVRFEPAFLNIEEIERPIALTHGNDGTGRIFIASQKGNIYVLDKPDAEPRLFLDFQSRVSYKDNENEEGFLGLAFHPQFKTNGQFFVYYTKKDADPHTSVISRFTANKETVQTCDPKSEEEVIRIPQPFWNHNGGMIVFGPDGKLYVGLGDGGAADDPLENGQNLGTLLGSILRLDVDAKDPGLGYAVPKDNPFVGQAGAKGEIWAYGVRNIWGISFDKQTGTLWAADVGQNIWEEINLVVKGGNYGWSKREGMHKFRANGDGPKPEYIEPIWEYHHDIGRSITGGHVYRGQAIPQLQGWYVYADYIKGTVWALKYDEASKKLLANREILGTHGAPGDGKTVSNIIPVMSFGQDEAGETYFLTTGNRYFKLVSAK
jgi:glucose/arabinose dehydrogenase